MFQIPPGGGRVRFSREVVGLLAMYAVVLVGLASRGIHPRPPWVFLGAIAFFVVPFAYLITQGVFLLRRAVVKDHPMAPWAFAAAGVALIALYHLILAQWMIVLLLFVVAVGSNHVRGRPGIARPLLVGGSVLFLGYAAVWGLNYLFASLTFERIHDADLLALDLAIYDLILGRPRDPIGMFPLVRSSLAFQLLENAYHILFIELFLVLFVLHARGEGFRAFLTSVFLCYFLGLLVFFVYPAVGPCIFLPETFDPAFHDTQTFTLMQGMYAEYQALRLGEPLSGFGYFVAVPSLHVALAALLQVFLYGSKAHFWTFLPINALMIVSTFLLGYHYIIDAPAGLLLAYLVVLIHRRRANIQAGPDNSLPHDSGTGGLIH